MIGKNNDKMRERLKNSFHFNAVNAQKFKNKYFNSIKKIGKKSTLPAFSSKEKRKSVILTKSILLPKSANKKMINILSSSKPQINYTKIQAFNYLLFCKKYANQMLKNKYNCSKQVRLKLLYYNSKKHYFYILYLNAK